ncbi:hypothetical protein [Halobacterium wangiae]|uniref:hypothetical protein n=1 Tax=Halobacterium wangiae TaxID=2902623 RepID=UPI001E64E0EB|nr:hypothetical protein [Halobacterium wangiae]
MVGGQRDGIPEEDDNQLFPSSEKDRTEKRLRELGLLDGAVGFRDNLETIFVETVDREYDISEKTELRNAGMQGVRDAGKAYRHLDRGVKIVNKLEVLGIFVVGVLTFFAISIPDFGLSALYQGGVSALITVFSWFLGTHLIIGKVTTEKLAYEGLTVRMPDEVLCFRAKWNKAVLTSAFSFLGVILVGVIRSQWSSGYQLGLNEIKEWLREKEAKTEP